MNEIINNILDKMNGQLLRLKKTPAELLYQEFIEPLTDKRIRGIDGYIKIFSVKRAFEVKKISCLDV